ncbi:MAG: peptidoglycan-binding protein [Rhodospirillales bacterium]|jgi:hypothetical protein|nr:peptidoglycan-binding protein [Rhodospirillales bacterium]
MKRFAVIAVFALALPVAPAAIAATADGRYAVKEAGAATCDVFVQEREKQSPAYLQFIGWVGGYLSGHNRFTPNTFDLAPWESMGLMDEFLAKLCSENRDKPFVAAVDFMISQFTSTKLDEASEWIEVKSGDKSMRLYKEVLRRAQERLRDKGLYKGTPDGAFGDGTRKAFEAFQKQAEIPVSGLPDQITLLRLFAPDGAKAP